MNEYNCKHQSIRKKFGKFLQKWLRKHRENSGLLFGPALFSWPPKVRQKGDQPYPWLLKGNGYQGGVSGIPSFLFRVFATLTMVKEANCLIKSVAPAAESIQSSMKTWKTLQSCHAKRFLI
ncbi:MAG: hypothetical protein LBP22_10940 [Deltaproteobacteria bacterium]|jgi:hypothetical protein|nr:hypothetical protein [Deltaproteobacteria bacterium]